MLSLSEQALVAVVFGGAVMVFLALGLALYEGWAALTGALELRRRQREERRTAARFATPDQLERLAAVHRRERAALRRDVRRRSSW